MGRVKGWNLYRQRKITAISMKWTVFSMKCFL